MFGSLFGFSDKNQQLQIDQLYQLHASFRYATIEFLNGEVRSHDGLGDQIQDRSMELYKLINKTRIVDEYDYWGHNGKDSLRKEKVNKPTDNTHEAVFALINNNKEKFDKLVEEGPSKDLLEQHNMLKADFKVRREQFLNKVQACGDHSFSNGFVEYNSCHKCGIKKDRSNLE